MKGRHKMRRIVAAVLTIVMIVTLFPVSAFAYVGAIKQDAGETVAGTQDGYFYLQNPYIGFYIRPDGGLTTVPSQKSLNDVKGMGATETHAFYSQKLTMGENNPVKTDMSRELSPYSRSVRVESDTGNPKLVQTFGFSDGTRIDVTYELVQLDNGASAGTTGEITEHDDSDSGKTWGVLSEAKISNSPKDTSILWMTRHVRFGGAGHSVAGNIRLSRSTYTYDDGSKTGNNTHYSAPLYSTTGSMDTLYENYKITEVFTDSFSYANQFIALAGYVSSIGWASDGQGGWIPTIFSGVRGHLNNYGNAVSYSPQNNSTVSIEHDFARDFGVSDEHSTWALWGFRDLYEHGATNIPADPASIPADAGCLGIVKSGSNFSAQPAQNENELKARYGGNLVAVFRGAFKQDSGNFIFQKGAVQLSPSLTATWTEGSGGFTVAFDGKVTAQNIHLSAPTFKFYKPKSGSDNSLAFSYSDGKLKIDMIPDNNGAILHIDIPGAKCCLENVTAAMDGALIFTGEMGISTPLIDAAKLEMKRLGMGTKNNTFGVTGVEASGEADMEKLLGLDVGSASAEINTFPGEERYAFKLELNVFDMFEAEGELELKRIYTGALIPNTLKLKAASEAGIPLVPPVVVAELNGLSGGFSNLAQTINGDFSAIPPLRLTIGAKGSVLEVIEGWYEITVGAGYFKSELSDGTILEMPIIDEYSWYMELAGDVRNYKGIEYTGLMVKGGMALDLAVTRDMPFIKAGSTFNASAFSGVNNSAGGKRMYVVLGADGKIYGLVQIPKEAWALGDLKLLSAEIDFAMGGQTDFPITNTTVNSAVKEAFSNISGYGGVAYTGSIIGLPFRIYYIFQDKDVELKVGFWGDEFEPFNPGPYRQALLDESTGEQIGILVTNDNVILLASSTWEGQPGTIAGKSVNTTPAGIIGSVTSDYGVNITQTDETEKSYEIVFTDEAPNPEYLAFSLVLKQGSGSTPRQLLNDLDITKSGGTTFSAILAEFNEDGEITNPDEANTVLGDDYVTLKLPGKGTWNIASLGAPFDIACYYASPYASLSGMNINSGGKLSGTVQDMDGSTSYILRTYLGTEKGGTDYLNSQSEVTDNGEINENISLSGGAVPTGSYYVTVVLLEQIKEDFDGDGKTEDDEVAFVKTDAYEFNDSHKVNYTNNLKPNAPEEVELTPTGSELMRASWKEPSGGHDVDGYYIRLYQKNDGEWIATGANYLLKQDALVKDAYGSYTFDMAVTAGNNNDMISPLEADQNYMIGITDFYYLMDEDGDGENDSFPVESDEVQSDGKYLPKANFPKLTYTPQPVKDGECGMKLLNINGKTQITIQSDVNAKIVVMRMDIDEGSDGAVLSQSNDRDGSVLTFDTPEDFDGALNLKIPATDAEGDVTIDYLGLRLDNVPPLLTLDSDSFHADYATGTFSVTGVTESNAKVMLAGPIITGHGTNGAELDNLDENEQVTADGNGVFTMNGQLTPADSEHIAADSATILLQTGDAAGNISTIAFAQIIREQQSKGTGSTGTPAIPVSSGILIAPENKPGQPVTAVINVTENGNIPDKNIKDAIAKAQAYAKENGKTANGISVVLNVAMLQMDSMTITLSRAALNSIVSAVVTELEISGATISLNLDLNALKEILNQSSGDVTITIAPAKGLSGQAQALIGNRPVYDVVISYVNDGEIVSVSNLGIGTATVSILYTPDKNEAVGYLFGVYADGEGNIRRIPGSVYNTDNRSLIITTDHLSVYGLGYADPSVKFTDIGSHWGKEYIDYAVGRRLLSGTSDTIFSPDTAMTRGMLVTVLGRMIGVNAKDYTANSFTDVDTDKYYLPYVEWAYKNGIVKGIGNQQFAPERAVTREEIAVIFANYAKAAGYKLPVVREKTPYTDDSSIGGVYKDAVTAMQQAGIMMGEGDNGNEFNPGSNATRAEVSAMLHRYIKLTINPGTAQGWALNDAGQYFYYEDGKSLTGWQDIDGVRYFFNVDETLKTGWVKDGEGWRYYSGNRMFTGWRDIGGKSYYFYDDGSLARSVTIDGCEVDENGVRITK